MSTDGQRTKWCRNIAENFNRLSMVHERYTQTTDGRTTTYSKRSKNALKTGIALALDSENSYCARLRGHVSNT